MRIIYIMLLFSLSLFADPMTPKQLHVLQTVRDVAKTIPDKNGRTYEDTVSAICITESSAGKNTIGDFRHKKSFTKASLGPMQIRVATARHVSQNVKKLRWLNQLNDVQLAARLLGDVRLSAKVATHYLVLLQNERLDRFNAISGYNGGLVNHTYYNRVMKNMNLVNHLVSAGKLT